MMGRNPPRRLPWTRGTWTVAAWEADWWDFDHLCFIVRPSLEVITSPQVNCRVASNSTVVMAARFDSLKNVWNEMTIAATNVVPYLSQAATLSIRFRIPGVTGGDGVGSYHTFLSMDRSAFLTLNASNGWWGNTICLYADERAEQ